MANKRIPVEETFSWQRPVKSVTDTLPGGPAKGDRYVLTTDKKIYWYDGSTWQSDTPSTGWKVVNLAEYIDYAFNGSVWQAIEEGLYIEDAISDRSTEITDQIEQAQQEISDYITSVVPASVMALVPAATLNDLAAFDASGQVKDSGVSTPAFDSQIGSILITL